MERTFKHLTKADRIRIEALIKAGVKIKEIADMRIEARYTES